MGTIKCGNCGQRHESAAEVRACYQEGTTNVLGTREERTAAYESSRTAAEQRPSLSHRATTHKPATDKQLDFYNRLAKERGVPTIEHFRPGTSTRDASAAIDSLKEMPVTRTPVEQPQAGDGGETPEGRYAVEQDGVLKFYKVDRPSEGRWAGYVFVKVQASDDLYPVRGRAKHEVLAAIAEAGVQEAMLRYGKEIGSCGHCGRTLTNEESRQYGIGPICRGKMGW